MQQSTIQQMSLYRIHRTQRRWKKKNECIYRKWWNKKNS